MKRPAPLILWLLLLATLSIDAVVIAWLVQSPNLQTAGNLFDALCFGQLSVACIWMVFGQRHVAWKALVGGLALLIAAAATARLFEFRLWETLALYVGYATLLVLLLWTIKQSVLRPIPLATKTPVWQFSLGQLLVLMTVVGVLISLLRRSELLRSLGEAVATDLFAYSVLAAGQVVIWSRAWNLRLRMTASLARPPSLASPVGFMMGCADPLLGFAPDDITMFLVNGLVQTLVIICWLEWGQILPQADVESIDESFDDARNRVKSSSPAPARELRNDRGHD